MLALWGDDKDDICKLPQDRATLLSLRRGVQPAHCTQPRMAMNVAQHKIVNLLKTFFFFFFFAHQFSLVFVYLMCGPRQLFFFHCGPEKPKDWTPLPGNITKVPLWEFYSLARQV